VRGGKSKKKKKKKKKSKSLGATKKRVWDGTFSGLHGKGKATLHFIGSDQTDRPGEDFSTRVKTSSRLLEGNTIAVSAKRVFGISVKGGKVRSEVPESHRARVRYTSRGAPMESSTRKGNQSHSVRDQKMRLFDKSQREDRGGREISQKVGKREVNKGGVRSSPEINVKR